MQRICSPAAVVLMLVEVRTLVCIWAATLGCCCSAIDGSVRFFAKVNETRRRKPLARRCLDAA